VVITEIVPDYTTFDAVNSDSAWVCDAFTAGSTCTFTIGILNSGESGSVLFAVLVENPLTAGVESILNDVSIADDGTNGEDPTPENNVDDEETPVDAISDLTITKDDGVVQVTPGEDLTYTIVVTNVENQTATGVVMTDTLPVGVVFVSASNDGVYDDTTREIIWNLGELAGGDEITLTVAISVEDPFTGVNPEIVNEVIVEDDGSNGVDPTPENNEDSDRDLIGDSAKRISDTNQTHTAGLNVAVGEVVTYTVTLEIAPGLVEDLVFTDIVDQGMAFIGCNQITTDPADVLTLEPGYTLSGLCTMAAISQYPATSTNVTDGGRQMVINFGDVTNISAAEEDITLTIEYDVVLLNTEANVDGQTMGNQAAWTWVGGSLEAEASPVTIVEPDLMISKSVTPKTAYNNQTVTFTVTLNHTEESNSDAFNLEITDTLPEKLTYVPGSLVFVSGQVPTTINDLNAPVLRVGWDVFTQTTEQTVLTYQARITKANPGAKIENTVTMEWTSLPGDVVSPQSPYNQTSVERSYTPGSNVDVYGVSANALINIPQLPETGFAPGVRTILPQQPENLAYQAIDDLRFAIPKQNLDLPIVGVPLTTDGWDLTWLSSQVGYLEGTAYPTWDGNTGLTAHVYNADGTPGPFVNLHLLRWGDKVEVTAFGQIFTYEVRSVERVSPNDLSVLRHEDRSWLTLITCQSFDETTGSYTWRVVVRAVLVSLQPIP
jgi:LPXTG-site transpeptidase (sortase) family protein